MTVIFPDCGNKKKESGNRTFRAKGPWRSLWLSYFLWTFYVRTLRHCMGGRGEQGRQFQWHVVQHFARKSEEGIHPYVSK